MFTDVVAQIIFASTIGIAILGLIIFLFVKGKNLLFSGKFGTVSIGGESLSQTEIELQEKEMYRLIAEINVIDNSQLKERNLDSAKLISTEIQGILKSHYLKLLKKKANSLISSIEKAIAYFKDLGSQDRRLTDVDLSKAGLKNEDLVYIATILKKKDLQELENLPENSNSALLIKILECIIDNLEIIDDLPDYHVQIKIVGEALKAMELDLVNRVRKNGFDTIPIEDWNSYTQKQSLGYIRTIRQYIDDLYWRKALITRIELWEHNDIIIKDIQTVIESLFDELRKNTIETNKAIAIKQEKLDSLSFSKRLSKK